MSTSQTENLPGGDVPTTISRYISEVEAAADVAALQSIGISTHLLGSFSSEALNYGGLALRNVEFVVPAKDAERAVRFLKEQFAAPKARTADWICSSCGEVNGPEFDACWSCEKTWSPDDAEYEPSTLAQPLPTNDGPGVELPAQNENPYAPPISGTTVQAVAGDAMEELIRRTFRGAVLSLAFPPLLLVVFFMALQGLVNAGNGTIPCSASQFRRLLFAMSFAAVFFVTAAAAFLLLGGMNPLGLLW